MVVRVKSNRLREVAAALPKEIVLGVNEAAQRMEQRLEKTVWVDTGIVGEAVDGTVAASTGNGANAKVGVGRRGVGVAGRGFYARFNEWGTSRQAARPRVGPEAERARTYLPAVIARHVRRACR